ncbi:MAG: DUF3147 family protein [Sulfurimonas sp.]|nr:DUF3147 family protein [Sulfurimonas sp.]
MIYFITKVFLSALIIVAIAEISKRNSFIGAILASLPLISIIAMIWIYAETRDIEKISQLSTSIFWLVIPSLALFITLPILLNRGMNFYFSLGVSAFLTIMAYFVMIVILLKIGVK